MRILIVSQYFWPENFRINDLARELVARGSQVTVLTGAPNYPGGRIYDEFRRDPAAFDQLDGVEIIRVPVIPRGCRTLQLLLNYLSFAVSASLCGAWKLRGRSFDRIMIWQLSPATIGLPGVLLRRIKRAPMLFWVQDLWPDTLGAIGVVRSPRLLRLMDRCMSWFYSHTDHLLAQSQAMMPRLRQQAPAHLPISYLPNWGDTSAQTALPDAGSVEASGKFKIFYLGNLGEAQDFPAVLDAVAHLRERNDIEWHFVGDGRYADWIRRQVHARNLSGRVHLHGAFPPEEMPRFHREADVLLVSLKRDPLFALTIPSKVQSYLAAGVPIVGMLDGEGARVILEANAGLACAAGDSQGLANAVLTIADMAPSLRAELGNAGKVYSRSEFEFNTLVDRIETLFRTATLQSRGRPVMPELPLQEIESAEPVMGGHSLQDALQRNTLGVGKPEAFLASDNVGSTIESTLEVDRI